MKYRYFMSYGFSSMIGSGYGRCVWETDKKITDIDDIERFEAEHRIDLLDSSKHHYQNDLELVVLSYQELAHEKNEPLQFR